MEFEGESIILEGSILHKTWKQAWKLVKSCLKKAQKKKERHVLENSQAKLVWDF